VLARAAHTRKDSIPNRQQEIESALIEIGSPPAPRRPLAGAMFGGRARDQKTKIDHQSEVLRVDSVVVIYSRRRLTRIRTKQCKRPRCNRPQRLAGNCKDWTGVHHGPLSFSRYHSDTSTGRFD
jgi:hypothetical protein